MKAEASTFLAPPPPACLPVDREQGQRKSQARRQRGTGKTGLAGWPRQVGPGSCERRADAETMWLSQTGEARLRAAQGHVDWRGHMGRWG